jgi:hypothetical protein
MLVIRLLMVLIQNSQMFSYLFNGVLIALALLFLSGCQTLTTQSTYNHLSSAMPPESQIHSFPHMTYDVIFLIDGKIRLLKHDTGEIETLLAPDVLKYSLSTNGQWLVAAKQVDSNPDNYELVLLNLVNRHSQIVAKDVHCLHDFTISPDGKRLLYIADDWNSEKQICQMAIERQGQEFGEAFYDSIYHPPFSRNLGGTIYVADFENTSSTTIGYCNSTIREDEHLSRFSLCISAYWTLDSENIIWFDSEGIWLADLTSNQPVKLRALFQDNEDHFYTHVTWSPSGKYLAMRGDSFSGNGSKRLILDWRTGETIEAPYASFGFFGMGVRPYMIWLNDDRLLFTKPMAIAETWAFTKDGSSLVLEDTANLASNDSDFIAASPYQLPDTTLTYAFLSPYIKNEQEHGLYQMKSLTHTPEQIINLPQIKNYASDVQVLWAPDGNGAIVQYWNLDNEGNEKQFYYVSNSSEMLHDITHTLGETAESVQWVP